MSGGLGLVLGHGIRAPAVAGVGRQPVSVGTLPTRVPATQQGPRSPDLGVREAWPVPTQPPEAGGGGGRRGRRGPGGATAARLAGQLLAEGVDLLPGLA